MTSRTLPAGRFIAEGVVIVVSILLAFSIDAWWDGVQENRDRTALLQSMRADFTTTAQRLDVALVSAEEDLALSEGYIDIVVEGHDVSDDSLRAHIYALGEITFFEPAVASYRTATGDGSIGLVHDTELIEALADFEQGLESYRLHLEISGDIFYLGSTRSVRDRYGSSMTEPGIPESDWFAEVNPGGVDPRSKEIFAAMEPVWRIHDNLLQAYTDMAGATARILAALDRLLE